MKYIINEHQYKLLTEQEEILRIPFAAFDNNWEVLQKFLEKRGFPPYMITDDLDLSYNEIEDLGNLTSVGGNMYLGGSKIKTLGNLTSVGGNLYLYGGKTQSFMNVNSTEDYLNLFRSGLESFRNINSTEDYLDLSRTKIESLGNLTSVGGDLDLRETPLSKIYTEKRVRSMMEVGGKVYL